MSYCRFVESDVYMYASTEGGIECCSCLLAKKVPTIFTTALPEGDWRREFLGADSNCKNCGGEGCDECMMHDDMHFDTYQEAIDHLNEHVKAGHKVPNRAFDGLKRDMEEGRSLDPMIYDDEEDEE